MRRIVSKKSKIKAVNTSSGTTSTTSSTEWQHKASINIDIGSSSDIIILWSAEICTSNGSAAVQTRIEKNNTDELMSSYEEFDLADKYKVISGVINHELNSGSHSFDLDFCSSANAKTVYIRRVVLTLIQV